MSDLFTQHKRSGVCIRSNLHNVLLFFSFNLICKMTFTRKKCLDLLTKSAGCGCIKAVFLQDQNFWGSLMTPCLKIWGSLANLEGQNFFNV